MTQPVDIEALWALIERATAGPWATGNSDFYPDKAIYGGSSECVAEMGHYGEKRHGKETADAQLIVAAVNALPSLLTELEALRAERGRLVEGLQDARAGFEASQVLISALSNGHPSVMIETFIERIDASLKEPSQ